MEQHARLDGVTVRAADSGLGGQRFESRGHRLPKKLSLQPGIPPYVTSDVWLVRGGLRHPVGQVADEIPPIPSVVVCSS